MFEKMAGRAGDQRQDLPYAGQSRAREPAPRTLWLVMALIVGTLTSCSGEQQSLTVTATAYNAVPGQTQGDPNVGAWGDRIRPGDKVIAVSPDLLALGLERGTKVRIEGVSGTYRVADRTNSRLERTIDIYMGTDGEKAREWGRQQVEIRWSK